MSAPRAINLIVIHCSASPNGRELTPEEIDRWHAARGFRRQPEMIQGHEPRLLHIGYHYVIQAHGYTRCGRREAEVGAHCAGVNHRSIGICVVGTDRFSRAQWKTLEELVVGLKYAPSARYPHARVVGHRDMSPDQNRNGIVEPFEWLKTCPGFDVKSWIERGYQPLKENVL
jgi:N-acetylmuramoyl-L-alanine amidase